MWIIDHPEARPDPFYPRNNAYDLAVEINYLRLQRMPCCSSKWSRICACCASDEVRRSPQFLLIFDDQGPPIQPRNKGDRPTTHAQYRGHSIMFAFWVPTA